MYRFHHWRVQIQDARDERAVYRVIQDYRLTIPSAMMELLPPECRDAIDGGDLASAALTLLQAEMKLKSTPEATALLHEVAHTYAAAAVRTAALRGSLGS